jgi:1,4-dihydroxy-2-naphthoate octaprenyltransferase
MKNLRAWVQAARLPSNVKILIPLLFGQGLAFSLCGTFELTVCVVVAIYSVGQQLFIVFLNDWADAEADAKNEGYMLFSGGSRVIPEQKIKRRQLLVGGIAVGIAIMVISVLFAVQFGRVWTPSLFAAGLILLWMYSFPPIKLSYRGMGELLQAAGCGALLPVIGFYLQAGHLVAFPWLLLIPFSIFHYTSAIATALPDQPADALVIKRTVPVLIGNVRSGWLVNVLGIVGLGVTLLLVYPTASKSIWVLSLILPAVFVACNVRMTPKLAECRSSIFRYGGLIMLLCIFYALGFCLNSFAGW